MINARTLAPVSLLLSASLFAATLPLEHLFLFALLHAFSEAAMIGGLADWFAVVALFRHPFGIPIPHTAIIPKHRGKLTRGIIETVQNRWLDKESIRARVGTFRFSEMFLRSMEDETNRKAALQLIRSVLREAAADVDAKAVTSRSLALAREHITTDDLLRWMKRGGELAMEAGWHGMALQTVLRNSASWLSAPRVQELLSRNLETIAENYSNTALRSIGKWIAEAANVLNYDDLARTIALSLKEDLESMGTQEDHPLRMEFERTTRDFVKNIGSNSEIRAFLDARRTDWFGDAGHIPAIADLMERAVEWFARDLDREDSLVMLQIETFLGERLDRFRANQEAQERMDEWVRERVVHLVEENHDEIGRLVQHNLEKLDDRQLVHQIEEKVGADLQYIRVNGAVVGGLVGTAIFLMKTFFS